VTTGREPDVTTEGGEAPGAADGSLSSWELEQVALIRAALELPAVCQAVTELATGQDPETRRQRRLEAARDELRGYRVTVTLEEPGT
jgi:hypothetical protein